jgi:chromosome segregation ATPase
MAMSKQKRKGSDVTAGAVATVNNAAGRVPLAENAAILLQQMNTLRLELPQQPEDDPILQMINLCIAKPKELQVKIQSLEKHAGEIEQTLDTELEDLKVKWQQESEDAFEQQKRLTALESERDALTLEKEDIEQRMQSIRDQIALAQRQTESEKQQQDRIEREVAEKIPKLQFQISLYAQCTGIKLDYENMEAWSGRVVGFLIRRIVSIDANSS